MRRKLLPYYGERKSKIDMIVLHAVAYDIEEAIKSFCDNEVSSHYIVAEDGEIWQLVGEKRRARHAGVSYWQGIEDVNSHSIGIEFCSKRSEIDVPIGTRVTMGLGILPPIVSHFMVTGAENLIAVATLYNVSTLYTITPAVIGKLPGFTSLPVA